VEGGVLHLRPTLTADVVGEGPLLAGGSLDLRGSDPATLCTGPQWDGCLKMSFGGAAILPPVMSARVRTAETFAFRYGRMETRAKLPRGDWTWPAIWLLPHRYDYGSPWPVSGEIDVMESRGNAPGYPAGGRDTVASTLHWGPRYDANRYGMTSAHHTGVDLSADFHIYGMVWSPTRLYTYLDVDDAAHRVLDVDFTASGGMWQRGRFQAGLENPWRAGGPAAPFDAPFYIIMNVAVGGAFFPPGNGRPWGGFGDFWNARAAWQPSWRNGGAGMAVDYVRVWQRADVAGTSVWPPLWGLSPLFYSNRSLPQPARCGNGACEASGGESCLSCPADCGICPTPLPPTPPPQLDVGWCAANVTLRVTLTGSCVGLELQRRIADALANATGAGSGVQVVAIAAAADGT
jgi:hypothetical protein